MALKFDACERKTQGARRYQEDCCRFGARGASSWHETPGLAVLADGMGGEGRGDLAAKIAVDSFIRTFERSAFDPPRRLRPALQAANAALDEFKRSDLGLPPNMGCTLLAALIWNGRLYWISVGDSPLYLVERDELRQLNEDHSRAVEVDQALAAGEIDIHASRVDPRRHQLTSALVGREIPLIDECVTPVRLSAGDLVIVASDGIQTLSDEQLARAIAGAQRSGAEAVADTILRDVDRARDNDQDNATVMVIDVQQAAERVGTLADADPLLEDEADLFAPAGAAPGFDLDGDGEPDTGPDAPRVRPRVHGLRSLDRFDPALISRAGTVALGLLVAVVTVFVMLQIFDRAGTRTVDRGAGRTTVAPATPARDAGGDPAPSADTGDTPIPFPSPANSQSWDGG